MAATKIRTPMSISAHTSDTRLAMIEKIMRRSCRRKPKTRMMRTARKIRMIRTSRRAEKPPAVWEDMTSMMLVHIRRDSKMFHFHWGPLRNFDCSARMRMTISTTNTARMPFWTLSTNGSQGFAFPDSRLCMFMSTPMARKTALITTSTAMIAWKSSLSVMGRSSRCNQFSGIMMSEFPVCRREIVAVLRRDRSARPSSLWELADCELSKESELPALSSDVCGPHGGGGGSGQAGGAGPLTAGAW
mmetsp:Transcript_122240/g.346540  ORF Transcript_122240/g.346540 Transcript_122240/m.346540 type:complete len:245 (-) Transcript_122240:264-998(-)